MRSVRWKLLLSHIDRSLSTFYLFQVIILGFFVNLLIPIRAGEVLRAVLLQRGRGIGFLQGFSSIVVERVLDLFAVVFIATLTLYFLPPEMEVPSLFLDGIKITGIISICGLLILIALTHKKRLALSIIRTLLRVFRISDAWRERILGWISNFIDGAEGFSRSFIHSLSILALSLVLWLIQAVNYIFYFKAFSLSASLAISTLGGMLMNISFVFPSAPGYVGTFEAFWALVFGGLGFKLKDTLPIGLLYHLISTASTVLLGSIVAIWMGLNLRELFVRNKTEMIKKK